MKSVALSCWLKRLCSGNGGQRIRAVLRILDYLLIGACFALVVGLPIYVRLTGSRLSFAPEARGAATPVRTLSVPASESVTNRTVSPK
jgi:hypothetical protein